MLNNTTHYSLVTGALFFSHIWGIFLLSNGTEGHLPEVPRKNMKRKDGKETVGDVQDQ